jgi:hypothetical protein
MNKKYNKKMTDMIQHAYKTAPKGTNQLDIASRILDDYKTLWPKSKRLANMTPEKIRSKFHTLKTQGLYVVSKPTIQESSDPNISNMLSNTSMKELMIHLMNKSDNLEFNLKDNKITIEFNL